MLKKIGLAAAFLTAAAVPAFADDSCPAPTQPTVVDGATATRDQVLASRTAVQKFIADSDAYQQCLGQYLDSVKADAAKSGTPVDQAMWKKETDKVAGSQAAKQKAGDDINTAITAYKAAHP